MMNAAAAKLHQSCPTLCDPIDGSPPGSAVPGVLHARTLEWVAISFSNASKWKVKVKSLLHVQLFSTPGTAAHQAPPSMGFSRQEYWSGLPLPSPIQLSYDPAIALLGIFQKEMKTYIHTKTCTWMFIETLFITIKNWKQSRYFSTDRWLNKLIDPYHRILFSNKKEWGTDTSIAWMKLKELR